MRFSVLPNFEAQVFCELEGFEKAPVPEEQSWYDVISYRSRMLLRDINEQGIIEVENSGGWGNDIRGKSKGVPFLRLTEAWLSRMDHGMKSAPRSLSAPPRVRKEYTMRSRHYSEGDITVDSASPISTLGEPGDTNVLWEEFAEAEHQVIENRMIYCKVW